MEELAIPSASLPAEQSCVVEPKVSWDELLDIVRCPQTGEALNDEGGWLVNESSTTRFPIVRGVPYLVTGWSETPKLLYELLRYRRFFHRLRHGEYEPDRVALKLDAVKEHVELLRRYFDAVVSYIDFDSRPLVLDTGAGMMETSYELSRRGARVVATDFSPAELENPRLYSFFDLDNYDWRQFSIVDGYRPLRNSEIDFARVLTETERLPFHDECFDVVFTRSSLHHLKNLRAGMAEMSRVLKRGGLLVVAGECIRPPWDSELEYRGGELDFQEGINERMRTWAEYSRAMRDAGFGDITAIPMLASGGLRWQRLLRRMGLYDPLARFDGRELKGASLGLLQCMGCVVGWIAHRTGNPPVRESAGVAVGVSLAEQIARCDRLEEQLHREALAANSDLPRHYTARTMPRPACYGLGPLQQFDGKSVCRMYSSGCLVTGGGYAAARAPSLRLFNAGSDDVGLEIEMFPTNVRRSWTIAPGESVVKLLFSAIADAPSVEFHFRWIGEGPLYFRRLG